MMRAMKMKMMKAMMARYKSKKGKDSKSWMNSAKEKMWQRRMGEKDGWRKWFRTMGKYRRRSKTKMAMDGKTTETKVDKAAKEEKAKTVDKADSMMDVLMQEVEDLRKSKAQSVTPSVIYNAVNSKFQTIRKMGKYDAKSTAMVEKFIMKLKSEMKNLNDIKDNKKMWEEVDGIMEGIEKNMEDLKDETIDDKNDKIMTEEIVKTTNKFLKKLMKHVELLKTKKETIETATSEPLNVAIHLHKEMSMKIDMDMKALHKALGKDNPALAVIGDLMEELGEKGKLMMTDIKSNPDKYKGLVFDEMKSLFKDLHEEFNEEAKEGLIKGAKKVPKPKKRSKRQKRQAATNRMAKSKFGRMRGRAGRNNTMKAKMFARKMWAGKRKMKFGARRNNTMKAWSRRRSHWQSIVKNKRNKSKVGRSKSKAGANKSKYRNMLRNRMMKKRFRSKNQTGSSKKGKAKKNQKSKNGKSKSRSKSRQSKSVSRKSRKSTKKSGKSKKRSSMNPKKYFKHMQGKMKQYIKKFGANSDTTKKYKEFMMKKYQRMQKKAKQMDKKRGRSSSNSKMASRMKEMQREGKKKMLAMKKRASSFKRRMSEASPSLRKKMAYYRKRYSADKSSEGKMKNWSKSSKKMWMMKMNKARREGMPSYFKMPSIRPSMHSSYNHSKKGKYGKKYRSSWGKKYMKYSRHGKGKAHWYSRNI